MCSLDELKAMARASGAAVSGTKAALEQRLLESAVAAPFAHKRKVDRGPTLAGFEAWEERGGAAAPGPSGAARIDGHDSASLKELCSTRGLSCG